MDEVAGHCLHSCDLSGGNPARLGRLLPTPARHILSLLSTSAARGERDEVLALASCDVTTLDKLDTTARCGFRPLRIYEWAVQPAAIENAKASEPLSDLKCKDGDGHNVYLYVSKME